LLTKTRKISARRKSVDSQTSYVVAVLLVGAGATLITDLWGQCMNLLFRMPAPNYCLVGRWALSMREGVFTHDNIAAAPKQDAECLAGWVVHFTVGIVFAGLLLAIAPADWLQRPTLWPALGTGIATVVFPYLIMQPAFGLGIAAARTAHPTRARLKSLMTHSVFGVGLYVAALVVSSIMLPEQIA